MDLAVSLKEHLEHEIKNGLYDGAVFLVGKGEKVIAYGAVGTSDRERRLPLHEDAVFHLYSLSKALTATVLLVQLEAHAISLDSKVCAFLDGFRGGGKENVTLRHLLSHTGGVMGGIPEIDPQVFSHLHTVIDAVCKAPLSYPIGEVHYSAVASFALLGGVLEVIDGGQRSFQKIMQEDLFSPLGMQHTVFGVKERERVVPVYFRDRKEGLFPIQLVEGMALLLNEHSEIPAGGATGTAKDLFLWIQMLRKNPCWLLEAITNQTGSQPLDLWRYVHKNWGVFPAYLGLGFWLKGDGDFPSPFGKKASPTTFGALGLGSTLFWIDPERDLSCVCLTSGLMEESRSFERFERLSDCVFSTMDSK